MSEACVPRPPASYAAPAGCTLSQNFGSDGDQAERGGGASGGAAVVLEACRSSDARSSANGHTSSACDAVEGWKIQSRCRDERTIPAPRTGDSGWARPQLGRAPWTWLTGAAPDASAAWPARRDACSAWPAPALAAAWWCSPTMQHQGTAAATTSGRSTAAAHRVQVRGVRRISALGDLGLCAPLTFPARAGFPPPLPRGVRGGPRAHPRPRWAEVGRARKLSFGEHRGKARTGAGPAVAIALSWRWLHAHAPFRSRGAHAQNQCRGPTHRTTPVRRFAGRRACRPADRPLNVAL